MAEGVGNMNQLIGTITKIITKDKLNDFALPQTLMQAGKDVIVIKTGEPTTILDKISCWFGLPSKFFATFLSDNTHYNVGERIAVDVHPVWVKAGYFTTYASADDFTKVNKYVIHRCNFLHIDCMGGCDMCEYAINLEFELKEADLKAKQTTEHNQKEQP